MTLPTPRFLLIPALLLAIGFAVSPVYAQDAKMLPTVDLSAEANRSAPNDLARATAYFEATDKSPAALATTVNREIAAAIELTRKFPGVKASTSGISTWPVHSKNGQHIEAWRMRSSIALESRDIPALSELLGKLQETLAVTSLIMQPAPETRASTADQAATDAIRAFEARAQRIAETLGKRYRIRSLAVNFGGGQQPVYPMMRSTAMMAESAPAPLEGGESEIVVSVSGTIELLD
jgi:predicted secreted protein